jgi:hypothetical protein
MTARERIQRIFCLQGPILEAQSGQVLGCTLSVRRAVLLALCSFGANRKLEVCYQDLTIVTRDQRLEK